MNNTHQIQIMRIANAQKQATPAPPEKWLDTKTWEDTEIWND